VKLTTHLHLVPRSKGEWSYTSTPPIRPRGVMLSLKKKHRDNLNFTFTICQLVSFQKLLNGFRLNFYWVGGEGVIK
jgi:hypothetical protein